MYSIFSPFYLLFLSCFLLTSTSVNKKNGAVRIEFIDSLKIGNVDTLEYRQVGPGIQYARLKFPDYPMSVYLLTVDLNNRYNFIETFQAANQVGKTQKMTTAATNGNTIAGVNGNFWIVPNQNQPNELLGVPHSGSIKNGEIITDPNNWNRGRSKDQAELLQEIGFAIIDQHKKIWIDDFGFDAQVEIRNVGKYPITQVNRMRKEHELVIYNSFMGKNITRTNDDGIEVVVKLTRGEKWGVNKKVECEVTKIFKNKGGNPILTDEYILSGTGKANEFLNHLKIGSRVKINMGVYRLNDHQRPIVEQMITGNALVLKNGIATIRNQNEAYNSRPYPRTGIGMDKAGKKLFLIVIDRSMGSVGASTATMCAILKTAGAWNATSIDGGGSAQLMLYNKIVNNPADGKERAVANGWFVKHNAPVDSVISKIEFADYKLSVPVSGTYSPIILGYNKYGVLIDENVKSFKLKCDPALGKITEDGKLIANSVTQKGTLQAVFKKISVVKHIEVL
jgi:hypothetical protein